MNTLETSALWKPSHDKVTLILLGANLMFWVYLWSDLFFKAVPYEPHEPRFEEMLPTYVLWGRALPVEHERNLYSLQLMKLLQAPSYWAARPYVWITVKKGILWDRTYMGVSPGGYLLLIIMGLSFGQWYLVGLAVRRFLVQKKSADQLD